MCRLSLKFPLTSYVRQKCWAESFNSSPRGFSRRLHESANPQRRHCTKKTLWEMHLSVTTAACIVSSNHLSDGAVVRKSECTESRVVLLEFMIERAELTHLDELYKNALQLRTELIKKDLVPTDTHRRVERNLRFNFVYLRCSCSWSH